MKGALEALRYSGAGLFFAGAAVLALLAGWAVYEFLGNQAPTALAVRVTADLPPGATIRERDVELVKVPLGAVPEGALQSKRQAVGKRVRFGIVTGDILREPHLVQENSDVAYALSNMGSEFRAVKLPGELVPAIDRLVKGDRLELMAVLPVNDQRVTSAVAVPIGVGTVLDVKIEKGAQSGSTVVVALPAEEVSRLALALKAGTVTVSVQANGERPAAAPTLRLEALTGQATGAPVAGQAAADSKPPGP